MVVVVPFLAALESSAVGAVDLHESQGRTGALPGRIKPLVSEWKLVGPALPVDLQAADNLWLHKAIVRANPGEVIVAKPDRDEEAGYWGEIMSIAAIQRGIGGLVLDGCVRDRSRLVELGLPVFCSGLSIVGTQKAQGASGSVGRPISCGSVTINRGDLVYGDEDGVVIVAEARIGDVIQAALKRKEEEVGIIKRLREGETTLEIYGLTEERQPVRTAPFIRVWDLDEDER